MGTRQWLSLEEDPRCIGLFRVLLGLLLIADVASLWPHIDYLYADDGVLPAARVCSGESMRRWSILCLATGTGGVKLVFAVSILSALAFALGFGTRVTKWVTAYLFASIVWRNPLPLAGEQFFGNFLFLLCLSRCGQAYSVDNWLRRKRHPEAPPHVRVPVWPRHLMIVQLCLIFGIAGWAKQGATYFDGTAFYYLLANDRWFRFEPWWFLANLGENLLRVATWTAWLFERFFPVVGIALFLGHRLRWIRWVGARRFWAPICVAFMGTLLLFANIGWFVPLTMASSVVLFSGEEVGQFIARVRRRPYVPATPSSPSAPRVARLLLGLFIGWHVTTMVVNSASLPHLKLHVPQPVRGASFVWSRLTNTIQFWGMFSRDAPRRRAWLVVDVLTVEGELDSAYDDRRLIGERGSPYVFVNRRQKAHAKIAAGRGDLPSRHAAHVCATWRDADGRPPKEVIISRWSWPILDPRSMAAHGTNDPRPASEVYREEEELGRFRCESTVSRART